MKESARRMDVQDIVERIRAHECGTGQTWPGRKKAGERAVTRYPNLCAEIEAHEFYLWCPADHAGITKELLADVIESGAELQLSEAMRLRRLFECSMDYLFYAPAVSVVDPATRKGIARLMELSEGDLNFRKDFGGAESIRDPLYRYLVLQAEATIRAMMKGMPVTYAQYRRAANNLREARAWLSAPKLRGRAI